MKKYYVTGTAQFEREVESHGETIRRTANTSFDRYVDASSAEEASEFVLAKVKEKHSRTSFGKINWIKITSVRVFELVMEKGA